MRREKHRIVKPLLSAVVSAFFLILTACASEERQDKVEITLMHGWGGTLKTHETMQEIYADFSKENPDINLHCIPYPDSRIAVEKANEMLAIGKMPDIISTNGMSYYVSNAVKCDQAMDLIPYIEADKNWKQQIHPAVLDTWITASGQMYTLPDALEVAGYWYNADYFKQAGIVDASGEVKLPATWEEFLDTADHIQNWMDETGKKTKVFALDNLQVSEFLFLARLAGEDEQGLEASQDTNMNIAKKTLEHVLNDLESLKAYSAKVDSIENARQAFRDGNSAIYFNGVWESDALSDSPNQSHFGYANYPSYDKRSLSYISPSSGYVLAKQEDSRKAEASIRFLKYMLSDEVQLKIAVETGQAPSNPKVNTMQVMKEYPLFGMSVHTSYNAQIQLKTIWSVWTKKEAEAVSQYMEEQDLQTDIVGLLQKLNAGHQMKSD